MEVPKVLFVKKGYLKDVDFALCVHPGSGPEDGLSTRNYACAPVDIEFWGKPAHAKRMSSRWNQCVGCADLNLCSHWCFTTTTNRSHPHSWCDC